MHESPCSINRTTQAIPYNFGLLKSGIDLQDYFKMDISLINNSHALTESVYLQKKLYKLLTTATHKAPESHNLITGKHPITNGKEVSIEK